MPLCTSAACSMGVLMVIYAIGSPRGTTYLQTSPQGTIVIMAAVNIGICLLVTVLIPCLSRHMSKRRPAPNAIKRMNLLGLVRTWDLSFTLICQISFSIRAECLMAHLQISKIYTEPEWAVLSLDTLFCHDTDAACSPKGLVHNAVGQTYSRCHCDVHNSSCSAGSKKLCCCIG